jgi:surface antigen
LFSVRVGVSAAMVGPALVVGTPAVRALTFGGWGTGFLAGRGRAAMRPLQASGAGPAASVPTEAAAAGAMAGPAVRTPLAIADDRPPRFTATPTAAESAARTLLAVADDRPPRSTRLPVPPTPTPTPIPQPPAPAPAFSAECPGGGYENIYPCCVCTWYAKEMRPDLPWFWGDYGMADNWGYAARACGFVVDTEPAPGAVIVFPPGANGASSRGHVGYVEAVGPDYVLFSECNAGFDSYYSEEPRWWAGGYPCIHRRIPRDRLDPGIEFIHGFTGAGEEGDP